MRINEVKRFGANTITPSAFHVPPAPLEAAASVSGAPPPRSSRFNEPWAKKPIARPSGDQNGNAAPAVPDSGCFVVVANERSQSCDSPALEATNTIWRPSGDSANDVGSSVAGVTISTRVSSGGV